MVCVADSPDAAVGAAGGGGGGCVSACGNPTGGGEGKEQSHVSERGCMPAAGARDRMALRLRATRSGLCGTVDEVGPEGLE